MIIIKQPDQSRRWELQFAGIASGYEISAVDSVTVTARGLTAEVTPLTIAEQIPQGTSLFLKFAGGTDGETYHVKGLVTDGNGERHEADVDVMALDLTWTVPEAGGATTYIEPLDYVARYGIDETIALTDEHGIGIIDRSVLFAALADAAAEIDGYISRRYSVPLDPVPPLVRRAAGDLARAYLHTMGEPPTAVSTAASNARKTLKDLAEGRAQLPDTSPISTGTAGAPQYKEGSNRPFSGDALEDF